MTDRSNIAIFSYAYHPLVGGAERAVHEITKRMVVGRFVCFTNRFDESLPSRETIGNVHVVRVGRGTPYRVSFWGKLRYVFLAWRAAERKHKQTPFTVLWVIMASYGAAGALLFKLCHPRIPILLTLQEGDEEKHIMRRVGIFYPAWKLIFTLAGVVQTISYSLADFAKRNGANPKHVIVVPNGVDLAKFKATRDKQKGSAKIIVTTSRLVRKNGIDILIDAFSILARTPHAKERYRLIVAGSGPEKESLEHRANELGIAEHISFLGHVSPEDIPHLLEGADVFVRPSRSEGLGNSFLEAMASGVPVVATRVGGIKDFLIDQETGLVVRSEDAADVAAKIQLLFNNADLRRKVVANALKPVEEKYSWDGVTRHMEALFAEVRKPSIVVATGIFPPAIGGPATYAKFLIDFERELGIRELAVVTYSDTPHVGIGVVKNALPKGIRHVVYAWHIARKAGIFKNTIVYAIDSSLGTAGIACSVASFMRTKFFLRVTGNYAWEQGQQRFGVIDAPDEFEQKRYGFQVELLRSIGNAVARSADEVIVPSSYLGKMVKGWGVKRTTVIPNPVMIESGSSREGARAKLHVAGRVVISGGRFVPWKGFKELIHMLPKVRKVIPDVFFVLVGDGPDREVLEREAAASGMRAAIRFTGILSKPELGDWLSAADLFVLNSRYEGLSHQLIEAVAGFGIPAVATDAGGNREVKEAFPNLVTLVPTGDALFADAITNALRKKSPASPPREEPGKFSPQRVAKELQHMFSKEFPRE